MCTGIEIEDRRSLLGKNQHIFSLFKELFNRREQRYGAFKDTVNYQLPNN